MSKHQTPLSSECVSLQYTLQARRKFYVGKCKWLTKRTADVGINGCPAGPSPALAREALEKKRSFHTLLAFPQAEPEDGWCSRKRWSFSTSSFLSSLLWRKIPNTRPRGQFNSVHGSEYYYCFLIAIPRIPSVDPPPKIKKTLKVSFVLEFQLKDIIRILCHKWLMREDSYVMNWRL